MADVVCLGILVVDVIARPVDRYPGRGELMLCDEMRPFIGGCAANTGIGLQKLGVETGVMGKVGHDGFGDFVRDALEHSGVDARGVAVDEQVSTSATMAMIASDAERSFIHHIGANAALTDADVDWDLVREARLLHIAGHFLTPGLDGEPCARVLKKARELGLKTALDTAGDQSEMSLDRLLPVLPYVDYLVPSYSEARSCLRASGVAGDTPEEVARVLQGEGAGVVALKMGEAGSYIRADEREFGRREWRLPPFRVEAVDATGAGDAFAAGFLAGIVHGLDLESTGKLANAAGACCVTALGTTAGIRSLDETLAFIAEQEKQGWRIV